jgi:hypothetical protein
MSSIPAPRDQGYARLAMLWRGRIALKCRSFVKSALARCWMTAVENKLPNCISAVIA